MESLHSGRCMDLKNLTSRTDLAASLNAEENGHSSPPSMTYHNFTSK